MRSRPRVCAHNKGQSGAGISIFNTDFTGPQRATYTPRSDLLAGNAHPMLPRIVTACTYGENTLAVPARVTVNFPCWVTGAWMAEDLVERCQRRSIFAGATRWWIPLNTRELHYTRRGDSPASAIREHGEHYTIPSWILSRFAALRGDRYDVQRIHLPCNYNYFQLGRHHQNTVAGSRRAFPGYEPRNTGNCSKREKQLRPSR